MVMLELLEPASLNPLLTTIGATVKAGDFLGLAGNAGTSSAPHLHVGLVLVQPGKWNVSIPLPFSNVLVIQDSDLDPADVAGSPWAQVKTQGLAYIPKGEVNGAVALGPLPEALPPLRGRHRSPRAPARRKLVDLHPPDPARSAADRGHRRADPGAGEGVGS
jgi:hypothetical protein